MSPFRLKSCRNEWFLQCISLLKGPRTTCSMRAYFQHLGPAKKGEKHSQIEENKYAFKKRHTPECVHWWSSCPFFRSLAPCTGLNYLLGQLIRPIELLKGCVRASYLLRQRFTLEAGVLFRLYLLFRLLESWWFEWKVFLPFLENEKWVYHFEGVRSYPSFHLAWVALVLRQK